MFIKNTLARINIDAKGINTPQGVGVGTPEAAVVAAYGATVQKERHFYDAKGKYLTIMSDGRDTGIRFEILDGIVSRFYLGTSTEIHHVEGCE